MQINDYRVCPKTRRRPWLRLPERGMRRPRGDEEYGKGGVPRKTLWSINRSVGWRVVCERNSERQEAKGQQPLNEGLNKRSTKGSGFLKKCDQKNGSGKQS